MSRAAPGLRDRKRDKPEGANNRVKAPRRMFAWAIEDEVLEGLDNPASKVTYLHGKAGGFHSWSRDEVEQFEKRHSIGSKARLAMALLLYTGQRRSDVVQFGRHHVREGWLRFTQQKGRNRKPVSLQLPVLPALQSIIDATPSDGLTFLMTQQGRPLTANGFGGWFRERCDEAGFAALLGARIAQGWRCDRGRERSHRAPANVRVRMVDLEAGRAMPLLMRNGTTTESDPPTGEK